MIRFIIYIGVLFLAFACSEAPFRPASGDLLFQVGESSQMSGAITAATSNDEMRNFTHVAIAIVGSGADSVLEATTDGGVRMTSLEEFLAGSAKIGGKPAVEVKRLRDTAGLAAAVIRARSFIGQPYDYSYLPDNGKMYCSELVWVCYLTYEGAPRFTARPMNFRAEDGSLPEFWMELFARLGEPVPEGVPGTNPNDLAKEPGIESVYRYYSR